MPDVVDVIVQTVAAKAKKDGRGNDMKWQSFMSTFVLNKMCGFISSGVRTDKGFKEVHLTLFEKQVFEFCGQEVSSTKVYHHLIKCRARWIQLFKLRDLSGASWDQTTCSIILEAEQYSSYIIVSSLPLFKPINRCLLTTTMMCFFL